MELLKDQQMSAITAEPGPGAAQPKPKVERNWTVPERISLPMSCADLLINWVRKTSTGGDQLTDLSHLVHASRTSSGQRLAQAHARPVLLILVDEDNAARLEHPLKLPNCPGRAAYFTPSRSPASAGLLSPIEARLANSV